MSPRRWESSSLTIGLTIVTSEGVAVSQAVIRFNIPVMIAVASACLPIFFTSQCIERWEGAVFLGYYLAYTLYLILDVTGHDALATYSTAMIYFVIPLTVLTIAVILTRTFRTESR